jgi:NAD(P)-dependent dehydrogenase (short-subunit alcohol dehydrogenase family)
MEIQGKVALVTGANRGIGREFARALVRSGAKVYSAARRPELVTDPGVVAVRLDVTDPASIAEAAELAADTQILVNNAGISRPGPVLTAPLDGALHEMQVNYLGTWAVTQAFAPVLARNGGGAVVNMLSAASWLGLEAAAGYAASKSAQWSLTNALRLALRRQGTLVVGVHSGYVDTDLSETVQQVKIQPGEVATAMVGALLADAEEVLVDDFTRQIKSVLSSDLTALYGARQGNL